MCTAPVTGKHMPKTAGSSDNRDTVRDRSAQA